MLVKINGKSEDVQGDTVLDLLKAKNIDPHMVAVELNSTMLDRDQLGSATVKEGDSVEFLFYMGGGAPCPGKRGALALLGRVGAMGERASLGKSRSWLARGWVGEVHPRGGRVQWKRGVLAPLGRAGAMGERRPWERAALGRLGVGWVKLGTRGGRVTRERGRLDALGAGG